MREHTKENEPTTRASPSGTGEATSFEQRVHIQSKVEAKSKAISFHLTRDASSKENIGKSDAFVLAKALLAPSQLPLFARDLISKRNWFLSAPASLAFETLKRKIAQRTHNVGKKFTNLWRYPD